ncbi:TraR/DksA family transcriptional regulator [Variovorax sp. Sphag1AA]|uniref:TraR/DksA family transcriptional regulator n=1 Tax=Variovorax sp. Sphag1AA TaxID=2587027 RepID=UPI00161E1B39|nr:TraR/DksA family transcriptional regulator [Variovorax sp. Sphag1AA]MBB3176790.1 RNA polymerase-binding transcription factor DksA [Variovorax sp. Sphag1AA]
MTRLTSEDRDQLRAQLEALKQRTLDELRRRTDPIDKLQERISYEHEVHNNAEDAEEERSEDLRFAEIDIDRQRLEEIEEAQRRMAKESYGVCVDCGEDIPRGRLMAYPTALRCNACQVAWERKRHG